MAEARPERHAPDAEAAPAAEHVEAPSAVAARPRRRLRRRWIDVIAGYLMVSPAAIYIVVLVGYPFFLALYFSLSNATVSGGEARFVGLANFQDLFGDDKFQKALFNSVSFTLIAQVFKGVLGVALAFLLLQALPGKRLLRIFLMLPWTLPISLSLLGWKWVYDPQFSVLNWLLTHAGQSPRQWLGDPVYTYLAILIVNVWRGFPFGAVIVLAGLTSIPRDIYDAAKVDGAGFFRTWHYVITPMIAPILFIGLVFDFTFTFGDLTIVLLLSNGGPGFATTILPLEAFHSGVLGGNISRGAANALVLFPVLLAAIVVVLRMLYRRSEV